MSRLFAAIAVATVPMLSAHAEGVAIVTPRCARPAPIHNQYDGTPGYFIGFKASTTDPKVTAAALAKKYHFGYQQYPWGAIFIKSISAETMAELRCVPEVEYVEFNAKVHTTGAALPGT